MGKDPPRTRVVGIVAERSAAAVRAEAAKAAPLCDLLEVRLDHLEGTPDPAEALRGLPLPFVASCRRPEEGGRWAGTEDARRALLVAAAGAGAALVDLEVGVPAPPGIREERILRSLHLPVVSTESAAEALRRLEAEPGAVLKLVLNAGDAPRALEALRLLRGRAAGARPLAALAAGPAGTVTRLLQPCLGGALLYAASRRCREVAAGIPPLAEVERDFAPRRLGPSTAFYALLGRPLRHSVSPALVNAALRAAGKDAVYVPAPCDDGERTARALLELGAAGLAFTAPHKAIPIWMASLSEGVAAHAVAANTLFRQGSGLVAANTDGPAVRRLAREALGSLDGKVALILGTGGTARALAAALKEERCRVHLLGRNLDKTAAAAATTDALPGLPGEAQVDLLFNATPVGQWPSAPRDPAAELCPGVRSRVRFDAVYNPRETAFLAAATGSRIRGVDMLVAQAGDQLKLFGIPKPDPVLMKAAAESALDRMELRVVLVGMRGAGKSEVGEALARSTDRPFFDTDRMVEQQAAKSVAEIFAKFGEGAFRAMERDAVNRALRTTGCVVALGGGAPVHMDSVPPSTAVIWLRARPGTLAERIRGSGRPPLLGRKPEEEVEALLREREPRYARLSTHRIDTDGRAPAEVAAEVAEALGL